MSISYFVNSSKKHEIDGNEFTDNGDNEKF